MNDSWADPGGELHLLSRSELTEQVHNRTVHLENLMDTMVDVLVKIDPEGRISMTNQAVSDVLGYDQETVQGKPIDFLFASSTETESSPGMLSPAAFTEGLLTEKQLTDVEVCFRTADGDSVPMSLSASVMEDEGSMAGIVCVAKDIRERKAAEERAAFLHSLLRHDLGNKLQISQGYLQLAYDLASEEVTPHVENSLRSTEEAIELVENVRTMHRLGEIEESEPVSLETTIQEVISQYTDLADRRDIEVVCDVESTPDVLAGSLLKELFANLLENALVHSNATTVQIGTHRSSEEVLLTVEDDGVGISDERKETIFDRRVKGSRSNGSGLGTYLAKRIAETYGGNLEVTDSSLGGARFDVTLRNAP